MNERMSIQDFTARYGNDGRLKKPEKRAHKYGVKGRDSCHCHLGHVHDSRKEAEHCDKIELLRRNGKFKTVRTQASFPLFAAGPDGERIHIGNHIVDQLVTHLDENQEVFETKSEGTATPVWKLKKKLFEANYPNIKYTTWYY